ncbi:hypothetical protein D3C73_1177820 [compost metagenome]
MIFHDGGKYRWFFAEHNTVGNQRRRGVHHVGVTGNTRQRFFNTFHLADRYFELATNMRIGTCCHGNRFHATCRVRWQRNAAPHRQTFHQHTPALTGHFRATDNVINRYKNIFTQRRTVLERDVQREVATTNFYARC